MDEKKMHLRDRVIRRLLNLVITGMASKDYSIYLHEVFSLGQKAKDKLEDTARLEEEHQEELASRPWRPSFREPLWCAKCSEQTNSPATNWRYDDPPLVVQGKFIGTCNLCLVGIPLESRIDEEEFEDDDEHNCDCIYCDEF